MIKRSKRVSVAKDDNVIGRLVDMDTKEVSLVDRPANKQTFLMVKSEDGVVMPQEEITIKKEPEGVVAKVVGVTTIPSQEIVLALKKIESSLGEQSSSVIMDLSQSIVSVAKMASSYRSKTNWEKDDGDPEKYTVILYTEPAVPEVVGMFATRTEADNEALRLNVTAVMSMGKAVDSEDITKGKKLGARVRSLREGKGLSLEEFATRVSSSLGGKKMIASSTLGGIERGDIETPSSPVMAAMATVLGVSVGSLNGLVQGTPGGGHFEGSNTKGKLKPKKPMRLDRLKSAVGVLREGIKDIRAGTVTEKFASVGTTLVEIVKETNELSKSYENARGITDTRGTTQDAPNVGSGVQVDEDSIGGIEAIVGEGTPDLTSVLKGFKDNMREEFAKSLGVKDEEIATLKRDLKRLGNIRQAPSSGPDDNGAVSIDKSTTNEQVVWASDMASELTNDWS